MDEFIVFLEDTFIMTKIDISRPRGDTVEAVFLVKNLKNKPINIHGFSGITMTVDPSATPIDGTTKVSTMLGELTSNGLDGSITVPIDGNIPTGNYFYDLQATTAGGKIVTLASGKYTVVQDITK